MAERRNFVRLVLLHLSADSGGQNFFVLGGKHMKKRFLALLLVLVGCCGSWGFALLARFTYPGVLPVLADSGRMTLANLLPTVGNLAFLAWFPLLAKAAPAWFVYLLPLWLLIGGAGSALGMASLMRPAFAQLEKAGRKEEEPEEEPDTEDSVQ